VKHERKRGRVALFLIFGVCKIRCRFGAVLGGFWEDFEGILGFDNWILKLLKISQISKPKLEAEKVVPKSRRGRGGVGAWVQRP